LIFVSGIDHPDILHAGMNENDFVLAPDFVIEASAKKS
jgi:hypothetical protein